uniref:Calmodulin n=2 Tax=Rhodosorus marinus TaxID=101924 RepID=A0A7S2ZLQ3_9RHOD|mmetsp:Transcript_24249/g.95476  ORF Transcript_24249/g.95476 Transcript_24249/m.95476 type:complete len:690 (+) Transcript_24249:368-2437(+)|eukprot:CAMPEP_0113973466 /NCGR_PEP_ID=MMETSP0011_2-20120614/14506_1 /TAXON_ID=101924 /ORGANISM="Rhodosorus marinus" /LENGTH=689 /DNA_ID=CAMNT_0000991473 /DNA_START=339 /DNA_END=2408 /DNA_ORIENTATION=- /assembly_acc=CAM_ASM_000156
MGDFGVPVVWVEDSDGDFCAGCSSPFSFTRGRHMCRMCGSGFCGKCSSSKRPVPWRGYAEPVRVCDMCVQAADRTKRLQRVRAALGNDSIDPEKHSHYFTDMTEVKRREQNANIMEALKRIYNAKIRPLEQAFKFAEFYNSDLSEGDFDARPMVLLVGQYSVGKTSFIRYLLERDFPGQRIGPEPTTDRFVAVMQGKSDRSVPGNAAAVDPRRPFSSLGRFGTAFLNRFEVSELKCPILDALYFVDTPGILSGEKQRLDRGYNFEEVVQWFAERADRIIVLFDAHKLDISDELKRTLQVLKSHEDKIRIILNKADLIDSQQLMRVYGALMWSLGKVVKSPEVIRVFLGSFWDQPLALTGKTNEKLFAAEKEDLISDLRGLPHNAALRRVNELVKRARLAKVHALLISHLRSSMPYLWGHEKKQKKLVGRLDQEYRKVSKLHDLAPGDFPSMDKFRAGLERFEISEFPSLSQRLVDVCDVALTRDVPNLILRIQGLEEKQEGQGQGSRLNPPTPKAPHEYSSPNPRPLDNMASPATNFFDGDVSPMKSASRQLTHDGDLEEEVATWNIQESTENPFSDGFEHDSGFEVGQDDWVVSVADKTKWTNSFYELGPSGHPPTVTGQQVRPIMVDSGLPTQALRKIWDLVDISGRGALDDEEFALAMYVISDAKVNGVESIPDELPRSFLPPSKR